MLLLLVLL